jgi:hypothetical protein
MLAAPPDITREDLRGAEVPELLHGPTARIIVARLHRDEPFAPDVMHRWLTEIQSRQVPDNLGDAIDYFDAAKPEPSTRGLSFSDDGSNPNEAFGLTGDPLTFEQQRAQRAEALIAQGPHSWLFDFHNTVTDQAFAIVPERLISPVVHPNIRQMLGWVGLEYIVALPNWMLTGTLLGQQDRLGSRKISVEMPQSVPENEDQARENAEMGLVILKRALGIAKTVSQKRTILHVTRKIARGEHLEEAVNFKPYTIKGECIIPILYDSKQKPTKGSYRERNVGCWGWAATHTTTIIC